MKQIRVNSDTVISRDICLERYLRDIRKNQPLTKEQELELIKKAQKGDKNARDLIIVHNLKFVINCAKEYQTPGVELIDLISAGNLGMIEAIDKFNCEKDMKFISYAVWWIKNAIIEFLKEITKVVRIPYNQLAEINRFVKEKEKLDQQFESDLSLDQVEKVIGDLDTDNLKSALIGYQIPTSLSDPISMGEEEGCVEDILADEKDLFEEKYNQEHLKRITISALNKLNDSQKQIITMAFGLQDGIMRTNDDIADTLDITAERVRQVKADALKRLRNNKIFSTCL
jgi:RNA polymerase primary sigma factor